MHMISKKDLSNAEMDTLTKSCSPTIVITANGDRRMKRQRCISRIGHTLDYKSPRKHASRVLSLGKLCDENGYSYEWINGQKPHLIKTGFGFHATRRTSFLLFFQPCQVRPLDLRVISHHLLPARLLHLQ